MISESAFRMPPGPRGPINAIFPHLAGTTKHRKKNTSDRKRLSLLICLGVIYTVPGTPAIYMQHFVASVRDLFRWAWGCVRARVRIRIRACMLCPS